jgi:hypothetical protein
VKLVEVCQNCHQWAWNLVPIERWSATSSKAWISVCHACIRDITERSGGVVDIEFGGAVKILLPDYTYDMPGAEANPYRWFRKVWTRTGRTGHWHRLLRSADRCRCGVGVRKRYGDVSVEYVDVRPADDELCSASKEEK